jgi:hypothetical protein
MSLSEDGRLLLAFQGRAAAEKGGWGPVRGFLVEVYDNGSVSAPLVIPGSKKTVQFPTVVAGTVGRAFVAWTEATEKGVQVLFSRARAGAGNASMTIRSADESSSRRFCDVCPQDRHHHPGEKI